MQEVGRMWKRWVGLAWGEAGRGGGAWGGRWGMGEVSGAGIIG